MSNEASQRRDLVDVVRFMLGTGARISEALAVEWPDIDVTPARPTSEAPSLRLPTASWSCPAGFRMPFRLASASTAA